MAGTKRSIAYLEGRFETGDIPTQQDFYDWLASFVHLDDQYFLGAYVSLAALQSAHPTATVGDYAYVDAGAASDILLYIWDSSDASWILSGGGGIVPDATDTIRGKVLLPNSASFGAALTFDADQSKDIGSYSLSSGNLTLTLTGTHKLNTEITFKLIADGIGSINFGGAGWNADARFNVVDAEVLPAGTYRVYLKYGADGAEVSIPGNASAFSDASPLIGEAGATFTPDASYIGKTVDCTNAAGCAITLPLTFDAGTTMNFKMSGGYLDFAADVGGSIESIGDISKMTQLYGVVTAKYLGSNVWWLFNYLGFRIDPGDLVLTNPGEGNVAIGLTAGLAITTGYNNAMFGSFAGGAITTGYQNTILGSRSGVALSTGFQNTLLGQGAGYNLDTQDSCVMVGWHAGIRAYADDNVYIGNTVGQGSTTVANNTGNNNTVVGTSAMSSLSLTTANLNSIFGHSAGLSITTASENTLVGYRAGYYFTSNGTNTAIGSRSFEGTGTTMASATNNVGVGRYTGNKVTSGNSNTFIGSFSGQSITTGSGNTFLGLSSGYTDTAGNASTTGSNNTFIGYQSGQSSTTQVSKSGAIGYRAKVSGSNMFAIGGATAGDELKVGINMVTPTARLHLPAGTATANTAPLKLTSGTNLTAPEDGAFEFDGTNLYFTTGGTRKTVTLV